MVNLQVHFSLLSRNLFIREVLRFFKETYHMSSIRLPSVGTVHSWRYLLPTLTQVQVQNFIDKAERLVIGVDATTVRYVF